MEAMRTAPVWLGPGIFFLLGAHAGCCSQKPCLFRTMGLRSWNTVPEHGDATFVTFARGYVILIIFFPLVSYCDWSYETVKSNLCKNTPVRPLRLRCNSPSGLTRGSGCTWRLQRRGGNWEESGAPGTLPGTAGQGTPGVGTSTADAVAFICVIG